MRILSFVVRVAVESGNVSTDNLADEISSLIREELPNGNIVDACLVETRFLASADIIYNDGVN